jgi:hypothetical protein
MANGQCRIQTKALIMQADAAHLGEPRMCVWCRMYHHRCLERCRDAAVRRRGRCLRERSAHQDGQHPVAALTVAKQKCSTSQVLQGFGKCMSHLD